SLANALNSDGKRTATNTPKRQSPEAEVGDACDDGNSNTDNDVITSDCECQGTIMFDCPALSANIGDTCDDDDETTLGDAINSDCECTGTLTNDCADLEANIGSACNDN